MQKTFPYLLFRNMRNGLYLTRRYQKLQCTLFSDKAVVVEDITAETVVEDKSTRILRTQPVNRKNILEVKNLLEGGDLTENLPRIAA